MPDEVTTEQTEEPTEQEQSAETDSDTTESTETDDQQQEEPDTFSREYVEDLRKENGRYRQRAQKADTLAQRLHNELVRATGRLADPSDLPYDEAHLEDDVALAAAIDVLLSRKPHLASRRPHGDIGQGAAAPGTEIVDLASMLRARAS